MPLGVHAAEALPGPGIGSMLQVTLGLGIVLALVFGAAWLARRLGVAQGGLNGLLKLRGGIAVGQRERVVILEVDNTWLVVGVAPGRITPLHVMPRAQDLQIDTQPAPDESVSFAQRLRRALEKRHG